MYLCICNHAVMAPETTLTLIYWDQNPHDSNSFTSINYIARSLFLALCGHFALLHNHFEHSSFLPSLSDFFLSQHVVPLSRI